MSGRLENIIFKELSAGHGKAITISTDSVDKTLKTENGDFLEHQKPLRWTTKCRKIDRSQLEVNIV